MTGIVQRRRARFLLTLTALLGALAIGVLVDGLRGGTGAARHERTGDPVLEGGADTMQRLATVQVTLTGDTYRLVRTDEDWRMNAPDGFPLREDRVAALLGGLRSLAWGASRTRDPRKFSQLSLGHPHEGGAGALVELVDGNGKVIAAFLAGRRGKGLYLRRPDDTLAFRAAGDLPGLHRSDAWMDFAVIKVKAEAIGAVEITDRAGETLLLRREAGSGVRAFRPGPAFSDERLVSRLAAASPALALSRFAPTGVKPADALSTPAIAKHVTMTHDGLEVTARAHQEPEGGYVTIRAVEAGQGARRARAINARAAGWAFKLSRIDWADFTPEVREIVERPMVDPP